MKKSKLTMFTVVVLLITMISLIMVSGTYAKYTTELTGTSTATVAKFAVGGVDSSSFDLFATVAEVDGTTTEEHVASGNNIIAPGTGGCFTITLTNDSDVAVEYSLTFTQSNSDIPIEYSTSANGTYYTGTDFATAMTGELGIGSTTQTSENVTIYWRWAFEGAQSTNYQASQTDDSDTALGEAATLATVEVTAKVVFTQID